MFALQDEQLQNSTGWNLASPQFVYFYFGKPPTQMHQTILKMRVIFCRKLLALLKYLSSSVLNKGQNFTPVIAGS